MRFSLIFLILLLLSVKGAAVPAFLKTRTVTQPDGTFTEYFLLGDEHGHWYTTIDGIPIGRDDDGAMRYVGLSGDQLVLTSSLAHNLEDRNEEECSFVAKDKDSILRLLSERRISRINTSNIRYQQHRIRTTSERESVERPSFVGNKKGLVILVNFSNKELSKDLSFFKEMFNSSDFHYDNAVGSVHDFFYDQSYGLLNLSFDVVGPVTVSHDYGYYGSNNSIVDGNDKRPDEMVVEACRLADSAVNFSLYDWNGDGEVEQVFILYAGYGEASGGPANTIWPHKHDLENTNSGKIELDGVEINTYACTCELDGDRGTSMCGIGTACHEFSHCLGLPDLYDTSYSGGFGMGYWDVMSLGSHNGPNKRGEIPSGYSAFERWLVGWLGFTKLEDACVVTNMKSIGQNPEAYTISNDKCKNEFYVLENRQPDKWFSYVNSFRGLHGMLVTHVDFDSLAWATNKVNIQKNHQRMSIIPADMSFGSSYTYNGKTYYNMDEEELEGDLYPGLKGITYLTDESHGSFGAKLYNENVEGKFQMSKPITEIAENDEGLMSFYFMGGTNMSPPITMSPSNITESSFTAKWLEVDGAETYTVVLNTDKTQKKPSENIIMIEEMARLTTKKNSTDGFVDLSDQLDNYMENKGWQGIKVFTSQYGAKVGTTSVMGSMTSPLVAPNNSCITVSVSARKGPFAASPTLQVFLMSPSENMVAFDEQALSNVDACYVFSFPELPSMNYRIKIATTATMYISNITIFDGVYTKADIINNVSETLIQTVERDVDGLKDCQFTFDGLSGRDYSYKVRAVSHGVHTKWSESQKVTLRDMNDIEDAAISCYDGYSSTCYNMGGRKCTPSGTQLYIFMEDRKGKKRISDSGK